MSDGLSALRDRLDELDRALIEQAARRMELVAEIREAKRGTGKAVFDRTREQEVYQKAEARAVEVALQPSVARELMTVLVEASHRLQADEGSAEEAGERPKRKFLIVGGAGKMGRLMKRVFEARGHEVDVLERSGSVEPARVSRAEVVIVAVPMEQAVSVTTEIAPFIAPESLLCDINSLKADVCQALKASAGQALGTHPMFGPTVRSLRRQKVVLCEVKPGPMASWFEAELGALGAEIIHADPSEHDEVMAVVQVLTHFGMMVMGRSLAHSGTVLGKTLPFMSPIYRLELAMVGRLFSQQSELYRQIMVGNPRGEALRGVFLEQAQGLAEALRGGDMTAFSDAFAEVQRYFADFSAEAMALSDDIIETITSRP